MVFNSRIPHTKSLSRGMSGASSSYSVGVNDTAEELRERSHLAVVEARQGKPSHGAEEPDRGDRVQLLPFVLEQPAFSCL